MAEQLQTNQNEEMLESVNAQIENNPENFDFQSTIEALSTNDESTTNEGYENSNEASDTVNNLSFGNVSLSYNNIYEVPNISSSAKKNNSGIFTNIPFGNCRLSKNLGSVVFGKALVNTPSGTKKIEGHKETFYSQKKLPGGALKIPGRHVATDGTVRDEAGYIVVAAPLSIYPRGTKIMTTLGPGKVYDTGEMKGNWIDIYTNR